MIYLASPYSHPDARVREERYAAVCEGAARLMAEGKLVYSPIAHSHALAEHGLPADWPYWEAHSRWMLGACSRLVVLALDGWQESEGVEAEVHMAGVLGKPVSVQHLEEVCNG